MAKPFEVYKKPHDYVNDFHKEWHSISEQYEKRTPEYFDEVRKFKKYWSERWEATEKKSKLIIYGFEDEITKLFRDHQIFSFFFSNNLNYRMLRITDWYYSSVWRSFCT